MFSGKAMAKKASSSKGSGSKGSGSEGSSSDNSPILVSTLWDTDNSELPQTYDIDNLKAYVKMALKRINPRHSLGEFVAIGSKDLRLMCEAEQRSRDCYDFIVVNDYRSDEVKVIRNTDIADLDIIREIILRAHGNQKHILIIAGDKDYLYPIQQFSLGDQVRFFLAVKDENNPRLLNAPCRIFKWSTMIYGGSPTN